MAQRYVAGVVIKLISFLYTQTHTQFLWKYLFDWPIKGISLSMHVQLAYHSPFSIFMKMNPESAQNPMQTKERTMTGRKSPKAHRLHLAVASASSSSNSSVSYSCMAKGGVDSGTGEEKKERETYFILPFCT